MDWKSLSGSLREKIDSDYSPRTKTLICWQSVLNGTMYDGITYDFGEEMLEGGEYIKLKLRRPSRRCRICNTVVEDSISLLFSEGHFPTFKGRSLALDKPPPSPDADPAPPSAPPAVGDDTATTLGQWVRDGLINQVMIQAATAGSVGSVAIQLVLEAFKPRLVVITTEFLTPTFDPDDSQQLAGLIQQYKLDGKTLIEMGYVGVNENSKYWFRRAWDENTVFVYLPREVKPGLDLTTGWIPDESRTNHHNFGFCPVVWIRNLPGMNGDLIDGEPTFSADAIGNQIAIDYERSQLGRALLYAADPAIVLSGPDVANFKKIGGAAQIMRVGAEGDAKLLELSGQATTAVLADLADMRLVTLEGLHGVQTEGDRVAAAQSGRAMELMHQALINLADRLRISYGEHGLLTLARMVCRLSKKVELLFGVDDDQVKVKDIDARGLELIWPAWFLPTNQDTLQFIQSLATAVTAHVISLQTAVSLCAKFYGIDDASQELLLVKKDISDAVDAATAAAVEVKKAGDAGKSDTSKVTA